LCNDIFAEGDEIKTKENAEEKEIRVTREDLEAEAVRVREGDTVEFAKKRVTSLKSCRRITIPGDLKKKGEELKLKTFVGKLEEAVKREEKRRKDGRKIESVLTEKQKRGKEKLQKRQRDKEIVLAESDKSGKITATKTEAFEKKMRPHVEGDVEVEREEVEEAEKSMSGCSTILARVMRLGENHGHEDRVRSAMKSSGTRVPPVDGMVKDHKTTVELPVRPVCKGKESPNGILSDLWSDIVESILDDPERGDEDECISTEEMCNEIRETNRRLDKEEANRKEREDNDSNDNETEEEEKQRIRSEKDIVMGSLDVKALYPELDMKQCAGIIRELIEESETKIDVNVEEMTMMIANMMTQEEIDKKKYL
jgi:hypothetical protein